jgi:secondary thiamine-phosphate synthase enzyme
MTTFTIHTPGRGLHGITLDVAEAVSGTGVAHIFLQHTSASLVITENADGDVLFDLNAWFDRNVPDGDPVYRHRDEGPDDMPSHIRAALTTSSLTVPVRDGELMLGTWQGIYLFEHRARPHARHVVVTMLRG